MQQLEMEETSRAQVWEIGGSSVCNRSWCATTIISSQCNSMYEGVDAHRALRQELQ